jgi:hypothetical protein
MSKATDIFDRVGIDEETASKIGEKTAEEVWGDHDDGRFLVRVALASGVDRATVRGILAEVEPRLSDEMSEEELRAEARRLLQLAMYQSPEDRKRSYAKRCAILAVLEPDDTEAGWRAHAALSYAETDLSEAADKVRSEISWVDLEKLIVDEGSTREMARELRK